MKSMWLTFIFVFFVGISSILAQQENVEQLLENLDEFSDNHELLELLNDLRAHPLDLNRASADELKRLPWISDVLARDIVTFRKKHGKFQSLKQLEEIPEIDPELLPLISEFLTIDERKHSPEISLALRSRIFRKLQQSQGYRDGSYYPSPEKVYNRLTINYGETIRVGALLEKDAGEKNLSDFQSYYFEFSPNASWKIIAGNYLLEFGQGLVFWNPYASYKSIQPVYSAKKKGGSLRPYRLVDENASLRGIAYQFCAKFYQITLFSSLQKLDATLDKTNDQVVNFYEAGYHRTENELDKKDQLQEQLFGSRMQIMPNPNLTLGITGYFSKFNRQFTATDRERYRFAFTGKENQLVGCDVNYILGDWNFFGEFARSGNNGFGAVAGAVFDTRHLDMAVLFRNYARNFHSFHGSGFGEHGDELQNERGLYLGFRFKILKNLTLSLYQDQFYFPWRTYSIPEPAGGADYLTALEYKPMRRTKIYVHFKHRRKPTLKAIQTETSGANDWVIAKQQSNLRCQFEFKPLSKMNLRFRFEKSWVSFPDYPPVRMNPPTNLSGVLLYQEISYQWRRKISLSARITFFDTDSYESRIYQFERDVPGVLTNQMLYGQGSRFYLVCRYTFAPFAAVAVKFGSTHYYFRNSIGTQSDMIAGDQLSTIAVQLQSKW
ncbi:hypothetical protein B6D60_08315 [candidate division KSB1 bacterium 4484_87]|nr:MAG: hypothetical protein B6D60_08315 [candidate division KSB1 bacterium 4484_87]